MSEINAAAPAAAAPSAPNPGGPAVPKPVWRARRLIFVRVIGLVMLMIGMWEWGWLLGAYTMDGRGLMDVRAPVRNMIALFSTLDLVAAVGLWLGAAWGPVIWIVDVLASCVLHTVYADVHGAAPGAVAFWTVCLIVFAALTVLMKLEERNLGEMRRRIRRETRQRN